MGVSRIVLVEHSTHDFGAVGADGLLALQSSDEAEGRPCCQSNFDDARQMEEDALWWDQPERPAGIPPPEWGRWKLQYLNQPGASSGVVAVAVVILEGSQEVDWHQMVKPFTAAAASSRLSSQQRRRKAAGRRQVQGCRINTADTAVASAFMIAAALTDNGAVSATR